MIESSSEESLDSDEEEDEDDEDEEDGSYKAGEENKLPSTPSRKSSQRATPLPSTPTRRSSQRSTALAVTPKRSAPQTPISTPGKNQTPKKSASLRSTPSKAKTPLAGRLRRRESRYGDDKSVVKVRSAGVC